MSIRTGSSQVLLALLAGEDIRYGDPLSFSGLTLIPLFSRRQAPFEYQLLSAAIAAGTAAVEEVGGGRVPTLRIVNRGEQPVLLVDGEHLVGVKQNRILNTTILVPEKSALDIPVSCVEAGRWGVPQDHARPSSPHLFTSARAKKAEKPSRRRSELRGRLWPISGPSGKTLIANCPTWASNLQRRRCTTPTNTGLPTLPST